MQIGVNSLLGMDLFASEILDRTVLHIPHSSLAIPDYSEFISREVIENELKIHTDWATDKIFDIEGVAVVKAEFSRLFCDVERFSDDTLEEMAKSGRGFDYTKTMDGGDLRAENPNLKQRILNEFYSPHHNLLDEVVGAKLEAHGEVYVVDCHSFSAEQLQDKNTELPDICIGFDDFHTPQYLFDRYKTFFESKGLSVAKNKPYIGTMIPSKFYQKNKDVRGVMIEINKTLYMSDYTVIDEKVAYLNSLIKELFLA